MSAEPHDLTALREENRLLRIQVVEREQVAHDLHAANDELTAKVAALEQRIVRMTKRLFGWSSERHHPQQQHIAFDGAPVPVPVPAPAATGMDAPDAAGGDTPALCVHGAAPAGMTTGSATTSSSAAAPSGTNTRTPRRPGSHPGRRHLPADTEVILPEPITLPEHERLDADGRPLPLLGYRSTDLWDFRPGAYVIRRIRRAIYGRPFSEADARVVAAMPPRLIPGGTMTDAAIIQTVIDKYADHLPLYRQEQRAARQGIHLSRSTLVGHVTALATACAPIYQALVDEVRHARYLHLDDTPVRVLSPGLGHTATGRIWVYRSEQATVFACTESRAGRHPDEFLTDYRGFIVADAYAGHNRLYDPGRAIPVGCWAHVRRKFVEMPDSPIARSLVEDIGRLYAIERELALVTEDERHRVRGARAVPLLTDLDRRLTAIHQHTTPASTLGKAVAYARNRWPTLLTYTAHGFLPIDNNPAENSLRPWAVGRKNWLFLGNHAAGQRAAICATLIENCRRQALDPFVYLRNATTALLHGCTDYHRLTPLAFATQQRHQATA